MTSTTPKVCVAICNYNHKKYLHQSIASIATQTYENLDIAIVDDGSIDQQEVKEIVTSFDDKRIRFLPLEKNAGKWNALNLAFSTTNAEICTSHDADDVSLSWRIKSQLDALLKTQTIHNLCGFISCWNDSELNDFQAKSKEPQEHKVVAHNEVYQAVLHGWKTPGINHYFTGNFETAGVSAMFYKTAWDLGFRFNPPGLGLRVLLSEDSDFNFRITVGLRSTSILLDTPYLYRRNTSTNKEEK